MSGGQPNTGKARSYQTIGAYSPLSRNLERKLDFPEVGFGHRPDVPRGAYKVPNTVRLPGRIKKQLVQDSPCLLRIDGASRSCSLLAIASE